MLFPACWHADIKIFYYTKNLSYFELFFELGNLNLEFQILENDKLLVINIGIPLLKNITKDNHPFVSDVRENSSVKLANGNISKSRWIQFKVPIFPEYYEGTRYSNFYSAINGISDLKTIRFIRLAIKGFSNPITFLN